MTRPQNSNQETVAAGWFTGIMTLAAGGAGLLVAGLVLGLDYLLHGDPGEREALSEQRTRNRQQRYDDALAWLAADRRDRERHRRAVRDWFDSDPQTRGDKPTSGETLGRFLSRTWNWLNVAGTRFGNGWKTGRDTAKKRRDNGDPNWWKPDWNARPNPEPRPATPEPNSSQGNSTKSVGDVVDAELVPNPVAPDRPVVPVGKDEPLRHDPAGARYASQLDRLQQEVETSRRSHSGDDPSPTHVALNGDTR